MLRFHSLNSPLIGSFLKDLCEHSIGVGGRSGGLSPSSLTANQSSEILGLAREVAQAKAGCGQNACGVEDVLQLLRILYIIGGDAASNVRTLQEGMSARTHTHSQRRTHAVGAPSRSFSSAVIVFVCFRL